jgi:hypothetical protein
MTNIWQGAAIPALVHIRAARRYSLILLAVSVPAGWIARFGGPINHNGPPRRALAAGGLLATC